MDSYASLTQATPDEIEAAHLSAAAEAPGIVVPALAALHASTSSMEEMAQRDLQVSLQLLAERMQYVTGVSAATVAVKEEAGTLCRASAGPMASDLGTPLRADPALITECMQQQQIICCNAAQNGMSTEGTSYATLGIKSVMVAPLVQDGEVIGILELLADRPQAFDDQDGATLERLSEMVLTALEHGEAAKRAFAIVTGDYQIARELSASLEPDADTGAEAPVVRTVKALENIQHCHICGFPISEGRTLCIDCENARVAEESPGTAPAFLSELEREHKQGWLQAHFYTIGTLLMVALTIVALLLKLR